MDCGLPGPSVHGFLQARILEWIAISSSRGIFPIQDPRLLHCRWVLYQWATREAQVCKAGRPLCLVSNLHALSFMGAALSLLLLFSSIFCQACKAFSSLWLVISAKAQTLPNTGKPGACRPAAGLAEGPAPPFLQFPRTQPWCPEGHAGSLGQSFPLSLTDFFPSTLFPSLYHLLLSLLLIVLIILLAFVEGFFCMNV